MNRYYFRTPYMAHPGTVYGRDEREARKAARNSLCCLRLPKGTEFWKVENPAQFAKEPIV